MKRTTGWLLPILASSMLALPGCGDEKSKALVGSWKLDTGFGSMIITFEKNQTWVSTVAGLVGGSESGEWKLDSDKLISTTLKSTLAKASIGKQETSKVVTLNESVLVLEVLDPKGQEQMITLQRVR